jgi:hypothetical protein
MLNPTRVAAFAAFAVFSASAPVLGQGTPAAIPDVLAICTPVIDAQYQGDRSLDGKCVGATDAFVKTILGPPAQADTAQTATDLVLALVTLYRDGQECEANATELPDAIALVVPLAGDENQSALIASISETVRACEAVETGATEDEAPEVVSPN